MMTKKTLSQYGVSYVEKNVEEDPAAMAFLKDQGYQAVPVVFSNTAEPIKGFRPDLLAEVAKAMHMILLIKKCCNNTVSIS